MKTTGTEMQLLQSTSQSIEENLSWYQSFSRSPAVYLAFAVILMLAVRLL